MVRTADDDHQPVEAGYWLSLRFAGSVPATATIRSVKVVITRYEESTITPGAILWQVGGGPLTSPTAALSHRPSTLIDKQRKARTEWDVTGTIDTPAEVNDLRFVVRNQATNGKKGMVDQVYLAVSHDERPSAPSITSSAPTIATVGQAYAYQPQVTGTPPISWSLVSGPAGMTVTAGRVSWTPASGSFPVTIRATNAQGTTTQGWTITASTAPAAATVLAAGDIADCNSGGDEQTAALLDANPGGTVLTLGDNAYESGTAFEYANCYGPTWGRHRDRTRPSPGNHEYQTTNAGGYFGYFGAAAGPAGRGYYSFEAGPWHVVSLNSERDTLATGAQAAWLRADLAGRSSQCVLAFLHRPRFTSGNYSDFTTMQPLWDVLYAANAEVVLSGHDHIYERYRPMNPAGLPDAARGLRQFVVGTGGRGHYALRADTRREAGSTGTFGVLKMTLRATGYDWEFLPVASRTYRDAGSGSCH